MNTRAPFPEPMLAPDRGDVVVLAPHPEDEVLGCGGTLALHALQQDRVHVIVAFDVAASDPRGRRENLVEVRRAEAIAGGAELGVLAYEFWALPDSQDPGERRIESAARLLARRLRELGPHTLYAPWIGEHPLDHHVLARVARRALELVEDEILAWGYEVWTPLVPTRVVDITRVVEKKRAAIAEHGSQLAHLDLAHKSLGLNAQRSLYLAPGARFGEAFAPLHPERAAEAAIVARDGSARGRGAI